MSNRAGTSIRTPFDILIGDWIGVGVLFTDRGKYYSHVASRVTLHELKPGDQHYVAGQRRLLYKNYSGDTPDKVYGAEAPPRVDELHSAFLPVAKGICRCTYTMVFDVDGKVAKMVQGAGDHSESILSATGYMSTNDNYSFIIRDTLNISGQPSQVLTLHNNHYYSSTNTRHVIGTISNAAGETIMTTSFTYTSYTSPDEL